MIGILLNLPKRLPLADRLFCFHDYVPHASFDLGALDESANFFSLRLALALVPNAP
jgi:hypothetical protein